MFRGAQSSEPQGFGPTNYGVKITASDGPPEGSLLLVTTPEQDALITESAEKSEADHNSGKLEYGELCNNCKDAAVNVVNNAGAGIQVDNSNITPSDWFEAQKKATVDVTISSSEKQPTDATATVVKMPKYVVVQKANRK